MADKVRIQRSKDSRLFLVQYSKDLQIIDNSYLQIEYNFEVHGTTGNYYTVKAIMNEDNTSWSCTCFDFTRRSNFCKHIYFILLRFLHCSEYDNFEFLSENFIDERIELQQQHQKQQEQQEQQKQQNKQEESNKGRDIDTTEECIICFDLLLEKERVHCSTCKNWIHQECKFILQKAGHTSCPFCRHYYLK